jgi:hypothetical protein
MGEPVDLFSRHISPSRALYRRRFGSRFARVTRLGVRTWSSCRLGHPSRASPSPISAICFRLGSRLYSGGRYGA